MTHRRLLLMLVFLLGSVSLFRPSEAAMPVVEVGPQLAASEISAVQDTITAVQAVIIVANQVLELTAMEEILDIAEDLGELQAIIAEGSALGYDLGSLQAQIAALFHIDVAPDLSRDLNGLTAEHRRAINANHLYAMRAQTLMQTAIRTVEHILAIIGHAGAAIGNLTISQSISEAQSKLQQMFAEANVRQTISERSKSLEGAAATVQIESVKRINDRRMADHPR